MEVDPEEFMDINPEYYKELMNPTITDPNYSLYTIELEDANYFVFVSTTESTTDDILFECEIIYDFAKIHKPVSIIESHPLENDYVEEWGYRVNQMVKNYMLKYGIDHVRGGSYKEPILSKEQQHVLDMELRWSYSFFNGYTLHPDELQRRQIQRYIDEIDKEDNFEEERKTILSIYSDYYCQKKKLDILLENKISYSILEEIKWLNEHTMNCTYHFTDRDEEYFRAFPIQRYKQLIRDLKKMVKNHDVLFSEIKDLNISKVYLYHPEILFDNYFFHYNTPFYKEYDISIWVSVCDIFQEMAGDVLEYMDYLRDELSTYPQNMEGWSKNRLYLLHHLRDTSNSQS